jgi:hypothetical protein
MLHFDGLGILSFGGFTPVPREERTLGSYELTARPDWSETKRRHLNDSSKYDPPSG